MRAARKLPRSECGLLLLLIEVVILIAPVSCAYRRNAQSSVDRTKYVAGATGGLGPIVRQAATAVRFAKTSVPVALPTPAGVVTVLAPNPRLRSPSHDNHEHSQQNSLLFLFVSPVAVMFLGRIFRVVIIVIFRALNLAQPETPVASTAAERLLVEKGKLKSCLP